MSEYEYIAIVNRKLLLLLKGIIDGFQKKYDRKLIIDNYSGVSIWKVKCILEKRQNQNGKF